MLEFFQHQIRAVDKNVSDVDLDSDCNRAECVITTPEKTCERQKKLQKIDHVSLDRSAENKKRKIAESSCKLLIGKMLCANAVN